MPTLFSKRDKSHGSPVGVIPGGLADIIQDDLNGDVYVNKRGGVNGWDILRGGTDGFINLLTVGARGDGNNDDALAIQTAIDTVGSSGRGILWPAGKVFRCNSPLTVPYDAQTHMMLGATLLSGHNGIAMQVGSPVARSQRQKIIGGRVYRNGGANWTAGSKGLQFINTIYSSASFFDIQGFHTLLELRGQAGLGQDYFTGQPNSLLSGKFPITLIADGVGSFCNDNTLMGNGSVAYAADNPNATGGYAVYLTALNGAFVPDNNKIAFLSLENAGVALGNPSGAIFCDGDSNSFLCLRYEGFASPFIIEGPQVAAGQNVYAFGRGLSGLSDVTLTNGRATILGYTSRYFGGGDGINPLLQLREVNSVNNKLISLLRTDGIEVMSADASGRVIIGPSGSQISRFLSGTVVWNPPSIADGAATSTTVPVGSAAVGDTVTVGFSVAVPAGAIIAGAVTSGSTVTVTLVNHTGAPLDLGSGTLRADVWQH